jgi:O-antigen/teichoic acid export membrane protein
VATAQRKLQLARLTMVQVGGQFMGIVVMLVLAWLYESVWALAIGAVVGSFCEMALGHRFLPSHRHALHLEPRALNALFHFGKWIFLATLVTFLGTQGLRAIQGGMVSTQVLGIISIAGALGMVLFELTNRLMGTVIFPTLSQINRDRQDELLGIINRIRFRILAATLPAFIALSLAAPLIISILYDDRYSTAGIYLAILAINGAVDVLPMVYQEAFLALGNSRLHFVFMTVFMFLRIVFMLVGYWLGGVEGMLAGILAGSFFGYLFVSRIAWQKGWLSLRTEFLFVMMIAAGAGLSWYMQTG